MKYTDRELEDILNKLIASTRSPRGRFQQHPVIRNWRKS